MRLGLNHEDPTMNASRVRVGVAVILCAAVLESPLAWTQGPSPTMHPETKERARVALSQALPKLNGDHLKATVVEVHYGPGESSPSHSHPCAVFIPILLMGGIIGRLFREFAITLSVAILVSLVVSLTTSRMGM